MLDQLKEIEKTALESLEAVHDQTALEAWRVANVGRNSPLMQVFAGLGKLSKEDYTAFMPAVERLVSQHGRIRILLQMHDFHGWTAGALWADTKFAAHHFRDIERLAMVGETKWQHGIDRKSTRLNSSH